MLVSRVVHCERPTSPLLMPRMADGCDMPHAPFVRPDLGLFCRLDELGLQVAGQRLELGGAVLACRVVETGEFARRCRRGGGEAAPRDSVTRRLAHEPLGWRPTTLLITIRLVGPREQLV